MVALSGTAPTGIRDLAAAAAPAAARGVAAVTVTKRFGGLTALKNVSVDFRFGEIHGLVGQNGAGKTTLASILFGLQRPDRGEVRVCGKPVRLSSPKDALSHGISLVQQRFVLARELTVAENVMLGEPLQRLGLRPQGKWEARVDELAVSCGLEIDSKARVADLPYSMQQRVAILRALGAGADLLILDEPTTNLTPEQVLELFALLFALRDEGRGIVLITHKIHEVLSATSRVTVLRSGEVTVELDARQADDKTIVEAMVGRPVSARVRGRRGRSAGEVALELRDVVLPSGAAEPPEINLEVHPGEILGVAGVAGNGQTELAEVIAGMREPSAGETCIGGRSMAGMKPAQRAACGLGYVPEDRHHVGTAPDLSLAESLALKRLHDADSSQWGFLRRRAMVERAKRLIADFSIVPPDHNLHAGQLSGGNLQKLLLARELEMATTVLVAAQPTQGLDIAARDFVYDQIEQRVASGAGVLLLSTELDEILGLSDRVAVLYRFGIEGVLASEERTAARIGQLMGGVHDAGPPT